MQVPSGITVNAKCANLSVGIFVFTWSVKSDAFVSEHVKTKTRRDSDAHFAFAVLTCPPGISAANPIYLLCAAILSGFKTSGNQTVSSIL